MAPDEQDEPAGPAPDTIVAALLEDSAEDLYENAPCGYLSALPDGLIVKVNQTLLTWTGYRREELVGRRRLQELLTPGAQIFYETHYAPLLRMQGSVREIAVELVCADARRLPVLLNSALRVDDEGQPLLTRTTVFNATDRQEYERELLRARRRAEASAARVRILQQVTADLAAMPSVADVAAVLVRAGIGAFEASGSMLWLRDDETGALERVAALSAGEQPELARIQAGAPLPQAEVLERLDVLVVHDDEETRRRYPRFADTLQRAGRQTVVLVPLVADERALGVAAFAFARRTTLDPEEMELLQTLGRHGGQALERARLYEAEQRLRAQSDALQRIAGLLAAALGPAQIADAVAGELVGSGVVDNASLAVVDHEAGHLRALGSRGHPAAVVAAPESHALDADVPPAQAARTARPLFFESREERHAAFRALRGSDADAHVEALAVLPLVVEGRAVGVLAAGWGKPRRLTAQERGFMVALAGQCAQALERARLHEETAERGRRSELLAALGRALDEEQGVEQRAQRLVDMLVPELADRATVDIAMDGVVHRVAAAHSDPAARQQLLDARRRVAALGGGPVAPRVIATRRAHLVSDTEHAASAGSADELVLMGEPRPASYVALPLQAQGRVLGALCLAASSPERRFRVRDVAFLREVAERSALALENARLFEQERDAAHTLQRSLLAAEPPRDPRFVVATRYRPAVETLEVGGDWHDAFRLGHDRLAVVVGDVVGRGIEAASAMGQLRSAIRALADGRLGPARLLERLDAFVERLPAGQAATVAYAELDLETGWTRLACAGHPPPVMVDLDGAPVVVWDGRSAPLGAYLAPTPRAEAELRLGPGTRLFMYTDGLVERRDRPLEEGLERLVSELHARRDAPLARLVDGATSAMLADERTRDDVCLLCLSFGVAPSFERSVRADPSDLAPLRRDLRDWLTGNAVESEDRDAIVLACSEAVANAIEHAYGADRAGQVRVAATVEDRVVELHVCDDGRWRASRAGHDRGRGFLMIGRLMDSVAVERSGGTRVAMRRRMRDGS